MTTTILDQSKSYLGTCQCCFNQQVTKVRAGGMTFRMVLHGYERPGDGWIIGDCRGHGEQPYELSCEFTKTWLGQVQGMLVRVRARLAALVAGEVTEIDAQVAKTREERKYGDRSAYKTITVTVGWVNPDHFRGGDSDFAAAIARNIRGVEGNIRQMESTKS